MSPLDDADNVYRTLLPDKPYRTRIKIQSNDGSGYDWYHPHRHGYVADQVPHHFIAAITHPHRVPPPGLHCKPPRYRTW